MKAERSIIILALCALCAGPLHAQELLMNYPLDTIDGEVVYKYQVEKSIGLYRIGMNFNVMQSEIVRMNPQLRERGLHFGETLLIPTGLRVDDQPAVAAAPAPPAESIAVATQDSVVTADSTALVLAIDSTAADSVTDGRRVVELALMLPFESRQTKRSQNAERMMEFYQGALLALHEVQNDSTLYRLRVYDTERSERRVSELCDSIELDHVQGIIGLAYPIQIERMAQWCGEHRVPLLLPFSDDTDLQGNSQLLQFNAGDRQKADSLSAWIAQRDSTLHCVALEVREADLTAAMRTMRRQMKAQGISYQSLVLHDLLNDSAAYAMDSTRENLIVLHSDKWQHVRMLIPHLLKLQQDGFRIRMVSQYSWQKEQIELPQVYASVFTAEAEQAAYDALWNLYFSAGHVSELPRYDLLGYDLMRSLLGRLQGEETYQGLQSDIEWRQVSENGGWQNANVRVVVRD